MFTGTVPIQYVKLNFFMIHIQQLTIFQFGSRSRSKGCQTKASTGGSATSILAVNHLLETMFLLKAGAWNVKSMTCPNGKVGVVDPDPNWIRMKQLCGSGFVQCTDPDAHNKKQTKIHRHNSELSHIVFKHYRYLKRCKGMDPDQNGAKLRIEILGQVLVGG